jgi:Holliday junction resolvase RusA-like endonuclease
MTRAVSIELSVMPLGTNNLYAHAGRRRFLTPRARENKAAMAAEARAQHRGAPLEGPLAVRIALYWPTRRNHDVDNIKALLDALTGILWSDDGQISDLRVTKEYRKGAAGVSLEAGPA